MTKHVFKIDYCCRMTSDFFFLLTKWMFALIFFSIFSLQNCFSIKNHWRRCSFWIPCSRPHVIRNDGHKSIGHHIKRRGLPSYNRRASYNNTYNSRASGFNLSLPREHSICLAWCWSCALWRPWSLEWLLKCWNHAFSTKLTPCLWYVSLNVNRYWIRVEWESP